MARKALLIVDVQNDFCPGGSLAVKDGDQVVQPLNQMAAYAAMADWPVIASRDWHPQVTKHFKKYGGIWPVHCVQGTRGAEFHPNLWITLDKGLKIVNSVVFSKGTKRDEDAYSAFDGSSEDGWSLLGYLMRHDIREIIIGGLATDYCVKETVLDALKMLRVTVLIDACRAVDLNPGDGDKAVAEMKAAGAVVKTVDEVQCEQHY